MGGTSGRIISFWSSLHGQACTTANMLAFAAMSVLKMNKNALLTQTHYEMNNLEIPLLGHVADKEFYLDTGIDALLRSVKSAPITEEMVHNCCTSILKDQLHFLCGTRQANKSVFEGIRNTLFPNILRQLGKYYDLVLVDTDSGHRGIHVLKEADLVVVNLRQNISMLDQYFLTDYGMDDSRVFYLFGAYDKESRFNLNNIRKKYKKINKANSAAVPYNIEFSDSLSYGCLLKYMDRNINADESSKSYGFMSMMEETALKILERAGL